ncbi:PIN/TRAM domain-containing protein [Acetobacterium fimetarium]|uniref:PIN/TRAM domain-containing protein n=1 Tax=Acetobacterium fimetarium TaxID=52691 RepID=A0ABR6WSY3_9FIRM|nr:PIN domain-containing protein [Acetobacterium fimetarium]MBC3803712.1 PIN/TRAM domain-containing protein [Acetobacterium fimetarium]
MIQKILRVTFSLIGMLVGTAVASVIFSNTWILKPFNLSFSPESEVFVYVAFILVFGLIFFILFPLMLKGVKKLAKIAETSMENVKLIDIGLGLGGLIIGLVIAMLISFAFAQIPFLWIGTILTIVSYIVLGYLGFILAIKKREDILLAFQSVKREKEVNAPASQKRASKRKGAAIPKLLDTSVIIDGRIFDICKTGFIEGPLVIPVFVLNELQLISDSSDELKRNRGRRGLDILNKIQTDLEIEVQITEEDFDDVHEVDSKLVKLGKSTKGKILTNDYNLNKVATVQGVDVLNINELANAVKPVVLPGEEMKVLLVKGGKENGQAIAYLDDGTMIVVENGKKYIGNSTPVLVTSILQTAAGRMIFAKPKNK